MTYYFSKDTKYIIIFVRFISDEVTVGNSVIKGFENRSLKN